MGNKSQSVTQVRTEAKRPQWAPSVFSQTAHPLDRFHAVQQALGNQGLLGRLQAKLTVNQPGDLYEQEADRVADAVMSSGNSRSVVPPPTPHANASIGVQRKCATCTEQDEEIHVQRKELSQVAPNALVSAVHHVLNSSGQPLDKSTCGYMESRFGRSFQDVRIHTDRQAADSAQALNAHAYTVGNRVVMGAGQYNPHSDHGRRLLAHELTHVVQQGTGKAPPQIQRQMAGCQELLRNPSVATFGAGTIVHQLIGAHFRNTVSGARNVIIPGASAAPLRTQGICGEDAPFIKPQGTGGKAGFGLPDLARISPAGVLQVAEIKPAALHCLIDGEEQVLRYIDQGNARDAGQVAWRASLGVTVVSPMLQSAYNPPRFDIWAPAIGRLEVRTAWCTAGLLAYTVRRSGTPDPVRVRVPERKDQPDRQTVRVAPSTYQLIKEFVKSVIDSGSAADAAAGKFLQQHPELVAAIYAAGAAAIIALLADDITIAGILDDVAIPPIILSLFRAAQSLQGSPALQFTPGR